ncbi:MAG: hypothetical protein RLZZ500_1011 [Bacteroidota bacterium]|jgi:hypothetical protein
MKILPEKSVFKNLPVQMDGYQLLIFDTIRVTFEMIEYDYEELEKELYNLSQPNSKKQHVSRVFSHAWGIIDHTSRLIKLFQKLPSDSEHKILDPIMPVNAFRNTIQHLHERIDESMIENKSPFYGILSWYHKNLETEKLTPKILVSGIAWAFSANLKIPDVSDSSNEINDITLQTVNKKETILISLSELMKNLKSIADSNEEKVGNFFKQQGWNLCDWSKRQDIMIKIKSQDEEKKDT